MAIAVLRFPPRVSHFSIRGYSQKCLRTHRWPLGLVVLVLEKWCLYTSMNMGLNNFVTLLHYNPFSGSYDMVLTSVQKDVTPHIIAIYPFITMPPWPHHPFGTSSRWGRQIFSRDEATLYERVSVRPSVRHTFAFRPTRSD